MGYRIVSAGDEGTKSGHSGLEVEGRGEWHQIDALAAFDFTPAFMYPLRLLLEAKCYSDSRKIGIDVVRNAVGVLKDISENYFTLKTGTGHSDKILKVQRFNYQSAIFSTSGYSSNAERYAIAHQVFLIQYDNVPLFKVIADGLKAIDESYFVKGELTKKDFVKRVRRFARHLLNGEGPPRILTFSDKGLNKIQSDIIAPLREIKGSYFGMLQGKWPMHLLSKKPLPDSLFKDNDILKCRVYGRNSSTWSFVPRHIQQDSDNWFRLEFDLPTEIAELVREAKGDKIEVAHVKMNHFSFISVSGMIGGLRRQVRLELDEDWIEEYLQSAKNRQRN